jgi:hypothetical protein
LFEATLDAKLDAAEEEWGASQPQGVPPPVIEHHPIDQNRQTGDSRLLGGAMSIHAPWSRDEQQQDPPV